MQNKEKKKLSLTTKVFIGLGLGALAGILIYYFFQTNEFVNRYIVEGLFYILGQGFMRLLQMLVVPLVFFSLSTGAMSMGDTASLGKIGAKTVLFYLFTTAAAVAIALVLSSIIKPGQGMDLSSVQQAEISINEAPSPVDTLLNIIPTNPIQALASGEMLQIILFALLVGIICAQIPEKLKTVSRLLDEGNNLMMKMTTLVMKVAPIGVFALIARTFSQLGFETFLPMLSYMLSVTGGLVIHLVFVYIPLLLIFTRLNPLVFLKKIIPVMTFAFSSASSGATIPLTLKSMDDLGVPRNVSAFTIPLGATINMDGTAIMQGTAVIFMSYAYGIPLEFSDFMTVILTATLASVGTAAIPGVGLVTLSMVLVSVGLPVEGIAVIMGIDRILDMVRTSVNVTGDSVVTVIAAATEDMLDKDQYYSSEPAEQNEEF